MLNVNDFEATFLETRFKGLQKNFHKIIHANSEVDMPNKNFSTIVGDQYKKLV